MGADVLIVISGAPTGDAGRRLARAWQARGPGFESPMLHSSSLNSKLAVNSRECQFGALTLIPGLVGVLNTAADLGDGANGADVWLKFPVGRLGRTRDDDAP